MSHVPFSDWPLRTDWTAVLDPVWAQPETRKLAADLERLREKRSTTIYPPSGETFTAFALTPFASTRVVILGQDPYHGPHQAHGLSFSVRAPTPPPPSLRNIFRELETDLGIAPPSHGDLSSWARSGVLLLNDLLTVEADRANSHRALGWEHFTATVIERLARRTRPTVFVLWGAHAQKKKGLLLDTPHCVIESAHPSPLSARRGFFGSRPFSRANQFLTRHHQPSVDWRID
jgi:uracil-DNA glycosylase